MASPLFVGGTSSNAGKSWMVTAICASLRRRGVRVAPFKAQTMSNHSFPCADGGEIGRAQVAQAEACGLAPLSAMNPILLKPNTNSTSQVVLRGRPWRTMTPRDYYASIDRLWPEIDRAYEELAQAADVIVIEGAGSVSEINLRHVDVANLSLAARLHAPWVLVADIERGGVFAAAAGAVALIDESDRARFRGVLVNKFRGDTTLFDEGRRLLATRCGAACLGVWPYADDLVVDAEDSLAVRKGGSARAEGEPAIAILDFPSLSNATDLRRLTTADWVSGPIAGHYDVVILPGTKDTMGALRWIRTRRIDEWVRAQHRHGATIVGVCGGYQILGDTVSDPNGVESSPGIVEGLGLLPVDTVLTATKTTAVRQAVTERGARFAAYEIHAGVTTARRALAPFARFDDGTPEGARDARVIGTYLHGALENPAVCEEILGVRPAPELSGANRYTALADWFDAHADGFYAALGGALRLG